MKSCLTCFQLHFYQECVPVSMLIEIIDLQSKKVLKEKYNDFELSMFYLNYIDMET